MILIETVKFLFILSVEERFIVLNIFFENMYVVTDDFWNLFDKSHLNKFLVYKWET